MSIDMYIDNNALMMAGNYSQYILHIGIISIPVISSLWG